MHFQPAVKNFQQVWRIFFFVSIKIFIVARNLAYLKKWLREHRNHPYPSNQEKIQLAKQSSITYDQVTTWFNNARAILRRRQAKLRHSFDTTEDDNDNDNNNDDDDDEQSLHENKKRSEFSKSKKSTNK